MSRIDVSVKSSDGPIKGGARKLAKHDTENNLLVEVAWEVCNQVGGIYTVIRSKAPTITERWGDNYCLIGPYVHENVSAVFDPIDDYDCPVGQAVLEMRSQGFEVHYGVWLVSGRPKVVLFNPFTVYDRLGSYKYDLWENHSISTPDGDDLINQVVAFGYQIKEFFRILSQDHIKANKNIIAHFHEWMAAVPIPIIRRHELPVRVVFTTHATMLGRYLAMNDPLFYEYLPFYDWEKEASHFNIDAQVRIERAAAHGCHVFTTVSDVTDLECEHLLGRKCDAILPNGINIERFEALHEFQNLHLEYKKKIQQFVMGHFFQSYSFDLDKTLYFFTSGRYEYKNKGYDLTLEALARLNYKMKEANIDMNVVTFFITRRPFESVNPRVLHSRAVMEEIRDTCDKIQQQIGERLFNSAASTKDHRLPELNDFVDDHMRLRLRRTIQTWKTQELPSVVTHNLKDDAKDDILNFLRSSNMVNDAMDKVKIVYHPDFISSTNPLFGIDYGQFVRGCHLGIFPSYYEPWGYTPLECTASGVPAVTSDLSGFGDYVLKSMPDHNARGIFVVERRHGDYNKSAEQLANLLFDFVNLSRRDRITQRNIVESSSVFFDWEYLAYHYEDAYQKAIQV